MVIIPNWFDYDYYMDAKLAQLKAIDPKGEQNGNKVWDADSLATVMDAAGFAGEEGAFNHFNEFGMDENISPNASFDATFYLNAKAAQLNALNVDGKAWTAASVMDAIKATGMNSAWEHFDMFGSQEGISTSANFDTAAYIVAKTALMNKTAEGGRANWTVDEVKAAFAEQGLNAVEHYNLYGQAEFKAANVEENFHTPETPVDTSVGFDPYTGVQKYTLADALTAQEGGALAVNYTLTDSVSALDAQDVTVAQQAALKDFVAGATNGADYANSTIAYHLNDTVANIANVSGSILQGSASGYDITDSVANIAAGDTVTLQNATEASATVSGDVSVVYTANALANMANIDKYDTTGLASGGTANITIDATAQTSDVTIKLNTVTAKDSHVTLSATGGAGNDYLLGNDGANTLVGGNGADWLVGGKGDDLIFAGSMTTQGKDSIYAVSSDTIAADAANASATTTFFGPAANSNWIASDVWTGFFKGHNIVEGREGNDTLVASTAEDLFLFQTGGGASTGKDKELTFTELGKDTIHNFQVGQDALFIMDQSENGDGATPTGLNHKFSAGWTADNFKNISLTWNDDNHTSATVTVDGSLVSQDTDLVINLVGVQGADVDTTAADLFGVTA